MLSTIFRRAYFVFEKTYQDNYDNTIKDSYKKTHYSILTMSVPNQKETHVCVSIVKKKEVFQ